MVLTTGGGGPKSQNFIRRHLCISPKAPEETEVSVHVSDSEDEDLDNDEYLGE